MTPPTPAHTLAAHRAVRILLVDAADAGLPMPTSTNVGAETELLMGSLADLTEWALWLEQPIASRFRGEAVHHVIHVGCGLRVAAVVPTTLAVTR